MVARIIISVLFLLFAVVQLNDPDPWAWVVLYGATAGITLWSAFRSLPNWLLWVGIAVIIVSILGLLPDFIDWIKMGMPTITGSMKAEAPHIELTREFLGLVLCGGVWWWLLKKTKTSLS